MEEILNRLFEKMDHIIRALNIAFIFNCDILWEKLFHIK